VTDAGGRPGKSFGGKGALSYLACRRIIFAGAARVQRLRPLVALPQWSRLEALGNGLVLWTKPIGQRGWQDGMTNVGGRGGAWKPAGKSALGRLGQKKRKLSGLPRRPSGAAAERQRHRH